MCKMAINEFGVVILLPFQLCMRISLGNLKKTLFLFDSNV